MLARLCSHKKVERNFWLLLATLPISLLYHLTSLRRPSGNSRRLPGLRPLPIIGNLLHLNGNLHHMLTHLARVHGPVILLKMGITTTVVVSSGDAAREAFTRHDRRLATRTVPDTAHFLYGFSKRSMIWVRSSDHRSKTMPSSQDVWRSTRKVRDLVKCPQRTPQFCSRRPPRQRRCWRPPPRRCPLAAVLSLFPDEAALKPAPGVATCARTWRHPNRRSSPALASPLAPGPGTTRAPPPSRSSTPAPDLGGGRGPPEKPRVAGAEVGKGKLTLPVPRAASGSPTASSRGRPAPRRRHRPSPLRCRPSPSPPLTPATGAAACACPRSLEDAPDAATPAPGSALPPEPHSCYRRCGSCTGWRGRS
ncbi:hypothetical protein PR202_ga21203 [Eleusine coracana subsp. coracana]|uniref:Uncharacterized protein n=1 Tax=Eleusine coracana subsp. coracana TaxID=191504 RepID=A0AAV5D0R9_ELECO|nr:hypothetical protein PR202_ga21203 [Eleusine coracana subsp. coracana]